MANDDTNVLGTDDAYEPPEVEELDTEEGPALTGGGGPATSPG